MMTILNSLLPDTHSVDLDYIVHSDLSCEGFRELIDLDLIAKSTVVIDCNDHDIYEVTDFYSSAKYTTAVF